MEDSTKISTASIICIGILKLLWYLFLVAAGILLLLIMVIVECANPKNNKNNC
jgi:hypothetical protein